jgi:hypothetical protein
MQLPAVLLLNPTYTARPVDARLRRVLKLAEQGEPATHRWDDVGVRLGLKYLNRLRASQGEADRERLAQDFPDLDAAYRLHVSADPLPRAILEARLLAGQIVPEVAAACGLTEAAVTAYEALFFDVLGKLEAKEYLMAAAVRFDFSGQLPEGNAGMLLKWYGLVRGPVMLDAMIRYFNSDWSVPERLDGVTKGQLEELHLMMTVRADILGRRVWIFGGVIGGDQPARQCRPLERRLSPTPPRRMEEETCSTRVTNKNNQPAPPRLWSFRNSSAVPSKAIAPCSPSCGNFSTATRRSGRSGATLRCRHNSRGCK